MSGNIWSRILVIIGVLGMLVGAIDPLEGSVIILAGVALAALGAFMGKGRRRGRLYLALALIAIGVGAMFAMTAAGGVGGSSGHSSWWLLLLLPYPIGWLLGLISGFITLIQFFRKPAAPVQMA